MLFQYLKKIKIKNILHTKEIHDNKITKIEINRTGLVRSEFTLEHFLEPCNLYSWWENVKSFIENIANCKKFKRWKNNGRKRIIADRKTFFTTKTNFYQ